ncbi:hypothetical protein [Kineococcus sp. NUM-3379]
MSDLAHEVQEGVMEDTGEDVDVPVASTTTGGTQQVEQAAGAAPVAQRFGRYVAQVAIGVDVDADDVVA